jgi:hypothetical protein
MAFMTVSMTRQGAATEARPVAIVAVFQTVRLADLRIRCAKQHLHLHHWLHGTTGVVDALIDGRCLQLQAGIVRSIRHGWGPKTFTRASQLGVSAGVTA